VNKALLQRVAYNISRWSILSTTAAGSGHPTSCLSAVDLIAVLFFKEMCFDPFDPENPNNDRFILSKGHAAPLLYAVWHELGVISDQEMLSLRKFDSILEGHPTPRFSRSEASTGSLGCGLSIGVGFALAARLRASSARTFVLMGDSEIAEGSVWEAVQLARHYKIGSLTAMVDLNRLGQSTQTMFGHDAHAVAALFEAFGWKALVVDGHDLEAISKAFEQAADTLDVPTCIVAKTFKGNGIDHVQNKNGFHGKAFSKEEQQLVLEELEQRFITAQKSIAQELADDTCSPERELQEQCLVKEVCKLPEYDLGEMVSVRKAFGQTLAALGSCNEKIVSLDAEVKNSTYAYLFEDKFPNRFFQSFIAEQNMVGMATGLASRGFVPFTSTFGVFFSRAHDQIRMAAVGRSPLRLVGTHAGLSIGSDGPSQMALEDIAMMRAIPDSVILYPSDAVSTAKCVQLMADHYDGITYLRATRMATSVLYRNDESFELGGMKIVRSSKQDVVCVVGAGVTLFQALEAYDELLAQGINISVIDCYSVKPLPAQQLYEVAQRSQGRVICVEDHYIQGGLGEAIAAAISDEQVQVTVLAVEQLPRSGSPEKLLAWAGIDAKAIVTAVKNLNEIQNK
jgi:transketolase